MYVDKFIGSFNQIDALMYWLNIRYGAKSQPKHWFDAFNPNDFKFVLILSDSGNGKSYLVELLSKDFNVELFTITSSNLINENDMNNFIKSINMQTLDGRKKIIFIDDLDEFSIKYKKKLIEIKELSVYPIIYTSTLYINLGNINTEKQNKNTNKQSFTYLNDGFIVKLHKPLASELEKFLKEKSLTDISDDIIKKISLESKSVRSAINSLINYSVNELVEPHKTFRDLVNDTKHRKLSKPLNTKLLNVLVNSIKDYSDDSKKLLFRLAEFDYLMNRNWSQVGRRDIHQFIVNNMKENVENLEYTYKQTAEETSKQKVYVPSKKTFGGFIKDNRYITYRTEEHFFRKYQGLGLSLSVINDIIKSVDEVEFILTWNNGKVEHYLTTPKAILDSGEIWYNDTDPYAEIDEQRIMPLVKMNKINVVTKKNNSTAPTIDKWGI